MRLKKIPAICGIIFFIAIVILIGFGIHYSNIIIYPPRYTLSNIPPDWEIKDYYSPQNYNLEFEKISFKTKDELNLKGWYIPAGTDDKKAILLVHGYGVNRVKTLKFVPFLHNAGYNLLLFDLRAHGESQGRYCSLGYYEKEDIHAGIKYLREVKGMRKVGILAGSMGAAVSILAMAENENIRAGIFDSPFSSLKELLFYRAKRDYGLDKFPLTWLAILITECRLKYDIDKVKPLNVIANITPRAIFLIHGDKDDEVFFCNSKALYEKAKQPKEFWLVQGSTHTGAFSKYPAEYEKRTLAFFKKYL